MSLFRQRSSLLLSRSASFRPEQLGQNALAMIRNLFFALFVVVVLIFTVIAATYQPEDPLFHPSNRITNFLSSNSNATFMSLETTLTRTGEDFLVPSNQTALSSDFIINVTDVTSVPSECDDTDDTIDCSTTDIFHLMMTTAIEHFKDIHFYRFGKAVPGSNATTCDMAWRFRPKDGKATAFYKDYRRFVIARSSNCTFSVVSIGDYHSGGNARKRKKTPKNPSNSNGEGFEKAPLNQQQAAADPIPVVGDVVNDSLPVVESESSFGQGKYLIYNGGGDRCKSMDHFLWSFLCALGEAQYLNRTLVMDLTICLSSMHTKTNQDEEGKDFRFYFDFEHLKESASVLDYTQFWDDWTKWQKKDGLALHLVEDFRVTPIKLKDVQDTLIMRKFGLVEPDNYWYRVCEGETESVIQRPWHMIWKSRRLMDIVSGITSRMNWDFDSVHVVRGEKAKNTQLWPNLAADTSPEALITTLQNKIDDGRNLYIATDEPDTSFFDPLKDKYSTHFLDEYKDLWDEHSDWYSETMKLSKGNPVEFDGYMRASVDTEVFLRGKKQIETFNDLTSDCKDGVNACHSST